jgi:deoxyribose-phosphate aldolase
MMEMVEAGASRIGTSASVPIIQELGAPVDN